jgi:hypothetical protein
MDGFANFAVTWKSFAASLNLPFVQQQQNRRLGVELAVAAFILSIVLLTINIIS